MFCCGAFTPSGLLCTVHRFDLDFSGDHMRLLNSLLSCCFLSSCVSSVLWTKLLIFLFLPNVLM